MPVRFGSDESRRLLGWDVIDLLQRGGQPDSAPRWLVGAATTRPGPARRSHPAKVGIVVVASADDGDHALELIECFFSNPATTERGKASALQRALAGIEAIEQARRPSNRSDTDHTAVRLHHPYDASMSTDLLRISLSVEQARGSGDRCLGVALMASTMAPDGVLVASLESEATCAACALDALELMLRQPAPLPVSHFLLQDDPQEEPRRLIRQRSGVVVSTYVDEPSEALVRDFIELLDLE